MSRQYCNNECEFSDVEGVETGVYIANGCLVISNDYDSNYLIPIDCCPMCGDEIERGAE